MRKDFSIRTTRSKCGMFFAVALDLQRERHEADVDAWATTRGRARNEVKKMMEARGYSYNNYREL